MTRTLLVCSLLLVSQLVPGQDQLFVLEGKIDKYPVIMEIDVYDSTCTVRYFYLNQKKDIRLEGIIAPGGKIKAIADDPGGSESIKEQFDLKKTASGYEGIWTRGKKKLAVILNQISADNYSNQYDYLPGIKKLQKEYPYDYIKTANLTFTKDSDFDDGVAKTEWYKEKYSGITMPRIKSGYASQALNKINEVLLEQHLLEAKNLLECSSGSLGEYELSVDHIFASKNVLSININVSYYCGGAHPDFGSNALNFEGDTGKLLNLDEIFRPGKTNAPPKGSDEWYTYRGEIFAPRIVELLNASNPAHMKSLGENDEDGCDYTDPEVWDFPNWYFTQKGMYIGAYFSRAARSCDNPDWSVIPYKLLKPYWSPDFRTKMPD